MLRSNQGREIIIWYLQENIRTRERDAVDTMIMIEKILKGELRIGCTANVVLIADNVIYCANAGDTRATISIGGIAVDLSQDHKPTDPVERHRIESNRGYVKDGRINGKLNVSRGFGDFHLKQKAPSNVSSSTWYKHNQIMTAYPKVNLTYLDKEIDFIVIACDGIWNSISSSDVVRKFYRHIKDYPQKSLFDCSH